MTKRISFYILSTSLLPMSHLFSQELIKKDTIVQNEFLEINVTAENVDFSQGTNTIHFIKGDKKIPVRGYKVNSPTSITVTTTFPSDVPEGDYDLNIDQWGKSLCPAFA